MLQLSFLQIYEIKLYDLHMSSEFQRKFPSATYFGIFIIIGRYFHSDQSHKILQIALGLIISRWRRHNI